MNRYQKPEVYERLAMEYSLGTLHGRARKRFESLMKVHPFIAAVVEENDRKFAGLVDLLPEIKPDDRVWKSISKDISESERVNTPSQAQASEHSAEQGSWWQFLTSKGFAAAVVLLFVSAVFLLKPASNTDVMGYSATLVSERTHKPMVDVQVKKDDMMMTIKLMEPVTIPDGMKAVVWCIAKDKTKPMMNMGTVASQGMTKKHLAKGSWKGIVDASKFAISIEPVDAVGNTSPSGDLIYVGSLKAMTKT